jgi:streptogramin lyase
MRRDWRFFTLITLCVALFGAFGGAGSTPAAKPDTTMRTVAGTGSAGYTGDGGPATEAQLHDPSHVSFGPRGEMYVAETLNHCIRRIDPKTGIITTVAGCGRKGYSGDGGPATAAAMNEPYGVVADRHGNLYIVDRLNAVVRRVDAKSGIITTLGGTGERGYSGDGGPAIKAQMKEPHGLAIDGKSNVYVADVADCRIRKIDAKTGIITTVVGTGKRVFAGDGGPAAEASIHGARAVDVDKAGNIYICEREGNRIRKVDAKSGIIQTIAGTGPAGYSGDGGPALNATFRGPKWLQVTADGSIYVVDTENHAIRRIDQKTGMITSVAGNGKPGNGGDDVSPTQAQLNRPHGCCVHNGMLYIADSVNNRVRVCPAR